MRLLDESLAADLRRLPLTYPEVGGTAGPLPVLYHHVERSRRLASTGLAAAADRLFGWQVHEGAGLSVWPSTTEVRADSVVLMRLLAVRIPCRVVYLIDVPHRRGFAYGTLPGHPESGEELFLLTGERDGTVTFTIRAFSRPASMIARLGGPLTGAVQQIMTGRYLAAADQ